MKHCVYYSNEIGKLWPSIKICIRNNYFVKDVTNWIDYISLLNYFGKDLTNSKYVCPENLMKEHDLLMTKKRIVLRKLEIEKQKKELEAVRLEYEEKQKLFTGLHLQKGKLNVVFLETIEDFIEEGDALHHCIYTNEY